MTSNDLPRVALCLSGQPRFFDKASSYFEKSVLSKFNCDVFLHTWFDESKVGQPYSCAAWNANSSDHYRQDTISKLYEAYQPVSFVIEPEHDVFPTPRKIELYETKNTTETTANITFSMFYSICKSLELAFEHEAKNNFKYDCVIRSRFDCAVDCDKLDFSNLEKNTIYFNDCIANARVMSDYFNFGTSDSMKTYSEIFKNIDRYWDDDNVLMCGEEMLTHHIGVKNKFNIMAVCATTHLIRDSEFSNKSFGRTWA